MYLQSKICIIVPPLQSLITCTDLRFLQKQFQIIISTEMTFPKMYILFRSTQYFKSRFFGTLQKTLYRRFWKTLSISHTNQLKFLLFSSCDFSPCLNVSQDIHFVWICCIFWRKKGCVSQNALNCVFSVHAFWCEKTIFCSFSWALDHTFNSNRSIVTHLLSIYFCRKKTRIFRYFGAI